MPRANKKKVSPDKLRAAALQSAKRTLRVLGICAASLAAMALITFGAQTLRHWFFTSPMFSVESVAVEGLTNAREKEILALSDIRVGENIFDVDLDAAAEGIRKNPWVEDVEVRRHLPRRIGIIVREHVPAALVEMESLYYADLAGRAFKRVEGGDAVDLPILRGISREAYSASPAESEEAIRRGISLAALYASAGLSEMQPLSDVEIDPVEGMTLRVGEGALAVRLGDGDYAAKFERLKYIYGELKARRASALVIRMDNRTRPGWVAVQLERSSVGAF